MKVIKRKDAKSFGLKVYFTGKACKRGHISKRYVANAVCIECDKHHEESRHRKPHTVTPPKRKRVVLSKNTVTPQAAKSILQRFGKKYAVSLANELLRVCSDSED